MRLPLVNMFSMENCAAFVWLAPIVLRAMFHFLLWEGDYSRSLTSERAVVYFWFVPSKKKHALWSQERLSSHRTPSATGRYP